MVIHCVVGAQAFAKVLHRPALFPMPEFAVNSIFGKERGVMLLTGPKVKPTAVLRMGYHFKYPNLDEALAELMVRSKQ